MTIQQIEETTDFLKSQTRSFIPEYGIVLGTGLGALVNEIKIEFDIPYENIPNFPVSTVETHKGRLLFGTIGHKKVVCMQGRFHFYEGYSMQQVTFPIRVMKWLGVQKLIVSNAAGGMNPDFEVSELMILNDHISLFLPENPLRGMHEPLFGDRFPDMSEPYCPKLIEKALFIAQKNNFKIHTGVYASVSGPQLETKADYRLLRILGADAVGMSTVPEVMVAHQMGILVFGISVITDMGIPETLEKAELSKILAAAYKAEPMMTQIIKELIEND